MGVVSAEDPAVRVLVKAVALEQAMGVLGLGSWVLQKGGEGRQRLAVGISAGMESSL